MVWFLGIGRCVKGDGPTPDCFPGRIPPSIFYSSPLTLYLWLSSLPFAVSLSCGCEPSSWCRPIFSRPNLSSALLGGICICKDLWDNFSVRPDPLAVRRGNCLTCSIFFFPPPITGLLTEQSQAIRPQSTTHSNGVYSVQHSKWRLSIFAASQFILLLLLCCCLAKSQVMNSGLFVLRQPPTNGGFDATNSVALQNENICTVFSGL